MIVVDASEFSEPLRFDIAAAKMAAITSPATPCGRRRTMKAGKISSLVASGGSGLKLVVGEQHQADAEEQRELREHHDAAEHDRLLAVAQVPARQQPLDQQLIGAVAGVRQERAAEQSGPERERHASGPTRTRRAEASPPPRLPRRSRPAARASGAPALRGQQRAADVDHELNQVGPDDRGNAAFEGVDQRQRADDDDRPGPQVRNAGERSEMTADRTSDAAKTRTPSASAA